MRTRLSIILFTISIGALAQFNPFNAYVNAAPPGEGCVVCDLYQPGDTFSLDQGISWYTVVDRSMLFQFINLNYDLSKVCVSKLNNMNGIFQYRGNFNQDISTWDVSNVSTMIAMFKYAFSFNQPLGNWDVSNVNNMMDMFEGAGSFNQPINNWDVSNVFNMGSMFKEAYDFNQPLLNWDVSNVVVLSEMFRKAYDFNQPLENWDVSNVQLMNSLFWEAVKFDQELDNWDVSNVTNMENIFRRAERFNRPLDSWDVSSVTNLNYAFARAYVFNQPIDSWDVSSATKMGYTFSEALEFDQSLDSWDVSSVWNFNGTFYGAIQFNSSIGNWNTQAAASMEYMFKDAVIFNKDIGNWDVSNVSNMRLMFQDAEAFNQDLGFWNVSQLFTAEGMFQGAILFDQDIGGWNINPSCFLDGFLFGAKNFSQDLSNWCVPLHAIIPSQFADSSNMVPSQLPVWGTCPPKCLRIDSVQAVQHNKGIYRIHFRELDSTSSFRMEYKALSDTAWQFKSFPSSSRSVKINLGPFYSDTMNFRLSEKVNGNWQSGCIRKLIVPCKDMSLQIAIQKAPFCRWDSALVRTGYSGGYGIKSILWNNGATTKRTYAQQGDTMQVSVTDASGCVLFEDIVISSQDYSTAPSYLSVSRNGAIILATWQPPVLNSGQTLIGYRLVYRLRNTIHWSNSTLTTTPFQVLDWNGSGLPAGNYEFSVFTRFSENGVVQNSEYSCIEVKGYNGIGNKTNSSNCSPSAARASIIVYPNPTDDFVNIQAPINSHITLSSSNGQEIWNKNSSAQEILLDFSLYPSGVYILTIHTSEGIKTEKIVKD